MTQTTTIDGTARTTVIKRNRAEWAESAFLGEVGGGTVVIHDGVGDISVVGHKTIITDQSSCTAWPRIATCFVGEKTYGRGETYQTGAGREIRITTKDENELLSRLSITGADGKRPAETVDARIQWLLASDYVSFVDNGNVTVVSDKGMDATDYRGQYPGDVVAACAKKTSFNYYIRWNDDDDVFELVFRDDNTSTDDTSTISITNDGTANGTSSYAPFQDAELTEDPEHVYSGVRVGYSRGNVYHTRAATAAAFVERDGMADDSGLKTSASAGDEADRFLWIHHTEEHLLKVTLRMRAAYVNLIRKGQRVPVTMTHFATQGYDSATYFRVLRRRVTQPLDTDNDYDVALDLSPQEAAKPASGLVQEADTTGSEGGAYLTLANPVTIGNHLWFVVSDRDGANPVAPNTTVDHPRWGAGAWTKFPNTRVSNGVGPTDGDGVAVWHKVADSTEQTGWYPGTNAVVGIFETANMDNASAMEVHKLDQAYATPMTIGSLGSPAAGSVNIMVGNVFNGSYPLSGDTLGWTPGTGWTADRVSPAYYGGAILWNAPMSYIAHNIGDGTALSATGTSSAIEDGTGEWCGIAISIPPL